MTEAEERRAIDNVANGLIARFPAIDAARIRAEVNRAYQQFARARIRDFVPIFVEREARRTLAAAS